MAAGKRKGGSGGRKKGLVIAYQCGEGRDLRKRAHLGTKGFWRGTAVLENKRKPNRKTTSFGLLKAVQKGGVTAGRMRPRERTIAGGQREASTREEKERWTSHAGGKKKKQEVSQKKKASSLVGSTESWGDLGVPGQGKATRVNPFLGRGVVARRVREKR